MRIVRYHQESLARVAVSSASAGLLFWLCSAVTAVAGQPELDADTSAGRATAQVSVDFAKDVQPILAKRCYACHGPDVVEGGLSFVDREAALAETDSGETAIVPGDASASHLIARITATADDWFERMPPEGDAVPEAEVQILRRWIEDGAAWQKHWAFEPLTSPEIPQVDEAAWSRNPVDAFLFDSLARAGVKPNPPAERATLIRRAYYDLIGLPPTAEQIQSFVDDADPLAFEKLVDELLQSPHYGERWGRHWLDLVRYGETNSFERDNPKPNAWKYRDYVIRSLNEDKPYDRFVREQLAGDELDDVTIETLTATGFYRLGIWDDEPADPKQAFYDEMDDLITTVGQGFLGLTINCARCHDHKIDPIPQTDYYSLLAFFGDVTTYGTRGNQAGNNQIDVSSDQINEAYAAADERERVLREQLIEIEQRGIAEMPAPDQRATEGTKRERDRVLKEKLRDHLRDADWNQYTELKGELKEAVSRRDRLPPRERVLGLATVDARPDPTFLLFRGSPHSPTDEVGIAFPDIFDQAPPETPESPTRYQTAGRRRILADWICDPENRLTSRVMANRIWQFHFGRGIVRSSNNFGQLGTPPTHPELLDWLAGYFVDSGWRLKSMHRLIMNSRAYQMSSMSRGDAESVDPGNDLFWRFDPRRLSAEEIRDSMLKVNGTLNPELYGPSVYPELSAEVMQGQSKPGQGWGDSTPEQQNRRSIYIHVKRSLLVPMLTAFDFPDPDRTCEARFMTLQPGQALALLNSDFAHTQARLLAESVGASRLDNDAVVRRVVPAVVGRRATSEEVVAGNELIESLVGDFNVDRRRAVELYCLSVMNWNEFLFLD